MTPVRSPTSVYVDMPSINLIPDEEMLFLGRPLQTRSPVELMSLLDRHRPNQTVPSLLTAPQTITAPVPVPDVSVQPAVVQPIQPLPATPQPAAVQTTSVNSAINGDQHPKIYGTAHFTVNLAIASNYHPKFSDAGILHSDSATSCCTAHLTVNSAIAGDQHPKFYGTAYFTVNSAIASDHHPKLYDAAIFYRDSTPAAVQSTSQFSHPLPVTISPSSLWQQYLTETVSPQPTAGQSTTQSAQQVPVPINPTTMEKDDIPTSDHSRVLKAPSSPPPIVEGSDPERPWMDGDKRRVEFRKKLHYNPLEKFK
ncbi:unnamed protein product [Mytilus edulis]|uniref:Uncharacterized protein n=1 Tax=Mytilus edulis TaxID=6550 RepID=A0A8S3RQY7_MYTED|nr:unnamed protein product [Mytilus edulis]